MRQALLGVNGVVHADVSYRNKRANVQYEPGVVEPAALIAAIDGTGFAASLMEDYDTGC